MKAVREMFRIHERRLQRRLWSFQFLQREVRLERGDD